MNEKEALEIIKNNFEDARGSIYYRDEFQAIDVLEEYIKNSVSKDKIRNVLRKAQDYDLSFKDIALFNLIEDLLKEH